MSKVSRRTYDEVMIPCYNPMDMMLVRGKGAHLYDSEGKEYLDFAAGIAVNCLGNCPKGVTKVIQRQCRELIHVSNIFTNDKTLTLAKLLVDKTGFERVFFVNSGTEANEAALKLARHTAFLEYGPDKDEIISFNHGFHGRTFFSVSVGGQPKYSSGFGPNPGAITHLPFNDIAAFEQQISDKTCAVMLEPIQGEGGIIPADPKFLKRVQELCREHHALLIFDEVQTGIARSGTLYAYEQLGVKPDILTTAKGLASGLPIGAVLTSSVVAKHFGPGTHGSTFGGNALACAVGIYVLNHVSKPSFLTKVNHKHDLMVAGLKAINERLHVFKDIRGMGLLLGAELEDEYKDQAAEIQRKCAKAGLLILVAGHDVLRFAPPLNIKNHLIEHGLKILEQVLSELKAAK